MKEYLFVDIKLSDSSIQDNTPIICVLSNYMKTDKFFKKFYIIYGKVYIRYGYPILFKIKIKSVYLQIIF